MSAHVLPLLLTYPKIDPVLIQLGPLAIRWYALAYIAGLVIGWRYLVRLSRNPRLWVDAPNKAPPAKPVDIDDILVVATLGVVLGGRIGYILFYGLVEPHMRQDYLAHPLRIFFVWEGGMSFHGGLIGVVVAIIALCKLRKLDMLRVGDLVAPAAPIGLFFGRLANFINGELYGHPTDVPWAMVFPGSDGQPRHPSQLYEATTEGLLLFLLLRFTTHHTRAFARPGLVTGIFLAGYGAARTFCEFFREPEIRIGGSWLTMGMFLSAFMWVAAAGFIWNALRAKAPAPSKP